MDHQTQKSPSSNTKYKGGVIPQADGSWGAQIIYNHHHHQASWLGQYPFTTTTTQDSAPHTYDRVASMFRFPDEPTPTQQSPLMNNDDYQQNDQDEEEEEDEQLSAEIIQEEEEKEEQHERMFEKPLTPSDVGKLNRLVIPKQHAERYFPLSGDPSDKGLLLCFEDESGKLWRFRYSYWNSSQSYVLTKGWSRFVKEKRLDAGDVVWFERRRFDVQRLFIRWRRRVVPVQDSTQHHHLHQHQHPNDAAAAAAAWTRVFYSTQQQQPYPTHHVHGPLLYQPADSLHAVEPIIEKPIMKPANSKRLRLFGVNLDCQLDDEAEPPVTTDTSSLSTQDRTQYHILYSQPDHYGSSHSNHKEFDFLPDVNQMRNG